MLTRETKKEDVTMTQKTLKGLAAAAMVGSAVVAGGAATVVPTTAVHAQTIINNSSKKVFLTQNQQQSVKNTVNAMSVHAPGLAAAVYGCLATHGVSVGIGVAGVGVSGGYSWGKYNGDCAEDQAIVQIMINGARINDKALMATAVLAFATKYSTYIGPALKAVAKRHAYFRTIGHKPTSVVEYAGDFDVKAVHAALMERARKIQAAKAAQIRAAARAAARRAAAAAKKKPVVKVNPCGCTPNR